MICCCPRLARAWRRGSRATKLAKYLERVKGIEPSSSAWKAVALPLSYTRELERALSNRDARLRPIRLRPKTGFGRQEAGFGGQVGWLASRSAAGAKAGGGGRTRTYEGVSQRIYSPPPLPLGTLPRRLDAQPGGAMISRPPAISARNRRVYSARLWGAPPC